MKTKIFALYRFLVNILFSEFLQLGERIHIWETWKFDICWADYILEFAWQLY